MINLTSTERVAIMRALAYSILQWDEMIADIEDEERRQIYINAQNKEKQALEKIRKW